MHCSKSLEGLAMHRAFWVKSPGVINQELSSRQPYAVGFYQILHAAVKQRRSGSACVCPVRRSRSRHTHPRVGPQDAAWTSFSGSPSHRWPRASPLWASGASAPSPPPCGPRTPRYTRLNGPSATCRTVTPSPSWISATRMRRRIA